MEQLLGSSITYRIAVGPQQGREVFALQTLQACEEPAAAGRRAAMTWAQRPMEAPYRN